MARTHDGFVGSAVIAAVGLAAVTTLGAQTPAPGDRGPQVEKTFGDGLPRDRARLIFRDNEYPVWPLTPDQQRYQWIDGDRMKRHVVSLAQIALKDRDAGRQWWGRLPGTDADREGMAYMTRQFEALGMTVERFPYVLPHDWRPTSFSASYTTANGQSVSLATVFPVADTKATGPQGLTAEAIWVGVGSGADLLGRDVKGKAVIIYSTFVPGGRSHSASDRAGLFNANTRAAELGAAVIVNVMGVPGNGQFQPEGGNTQVPHFTLSQDEGFALKERLDAGEKVTMRFTLVVAEPTNLETAYTIATLPGMSEEQIVIMTHTDGYFQAATDNAAGMASALEIARFYAQVPRGQRPRTITFIQFPDHHHGEEARRRHIDPSYPWDKVAVKLTMEHPSQTLLYMYNNDLTPTNAMGAFRWNALGSTAFEKMVFETLREFGVSVYAQEDGPKNGNYAPSFHIIEHVIYHTSLDTPDLVPASGLQRTTRAFAAVLDRANAMTMRELRGESFPPRAGQGSINGAVIREP